MFICFHAPQVGGFLNHPQYQFMREEQPVREEPVVTLVMLSVNSTKLGGYSLAVLLSSSL